MKSIAKQLLLLTYLPLLALFAILITEILGAKSNSLDIRKNEIRRHGEVGYTVLQHYHTEELAGRQSTSEAKRNAISAIKILRYGLSNSESRFGYYFLQDDKLPFPTMIMNAYLPELDGKSSNLPKFKSATGIQYGLKGQEESLDEPINLFTGFAKIGNTAGEGFLTYPWPKPQTTGQLSAASAVVLQKSDSQGQLFPKMSYVKKFEPWGWIIGTGVYLDDIQNEFVRQLQRLAVFFVAICSLLLIITMRISKKIASSINSVADVMIEIEKSGDLRRRMSATGIEEVIKIATAFNSMLQSFSTIEELSAELSKKNRDLARAESQIREELAIAREMQSAVLPKSFPRSLSSSGAARMLAATTMGGDFYDFIELSDGKIGLVIADVSGKGVPAAFFMAVSRTNLRSLANAASGPGHCLELTDAVLCTQNSMELFVTIFYAVFDPKTNVLVYANGGHNPPIIRREDGRIEFLSGVSDVALGYFPGSFQEKAEQLADGDCVLFYTDGVTEAFNTHGEMYGEERLEKLMAKHRGDAQSLVDLVFKDVGDFAAGTPQSDDITVSVLQVDSKGGLRTEERHAV